MRQRVTLDQHLQPLLVSLAGTVASPAGSHFLSPYAGHVPSSGRPRQACQLRLPIFDSMGRCVFCKVCVLCGRRREFPEDHCSLKLCDGGSHEGLEEERVKKPKQLHLQLLSFTSPKLVSGGFVVSSPPRLHALSADFLNALFPLLQPPSLAELLCWWLSRVPPLLAFRL